MNPTDLVDRANLRDDIPEFSPGDTVKVHVRVVEGNRERIQVFQGAVIRRQGSGVRSVHRPEGELRGWCGADVPDPLAHVLEDRAGHRG